MIVRDYENYKVKFIYNKKKIFAIRGIAK